MRALFSIALARRGNGLPRLTPASGARPAATSGVMPRAKSASAIVPSPSYKTQVPSAAAGPAFPTSRSSHFRTACACSCSRTTNFRWSAEFALVRDRQLFDPADKVGLAQAHRFGDANGGTKDKTGDQLDEELENMAASVESGIGETSGSVSFNALKENTDAVMAIFREVMHESGVPRRTRSIWPRPSRAAVSRAATTTHRPSRAARSPTLSTARTIRMAGRWSTTIVDNIKREDLVAFYKPILLPRQHRCSPCKATSTPPRCARGSRSCSAAGTTSRRRFPRFPQVTANPLRRRLSGRERRREPELHPDGPPGRHAQGQGLSSAVR